MYNSFYYVSKIKFSPWQTRLKMMRAPPKRVTIKQKFCSLGIKEINPEYSLQGLMLKLKLQDSGHLMQRANSLEKTLMLGKIKGRIRRGQQRTKWLHGTTDSMDMGLSKLRQMDREAWHAEVHGVTKAGTQLSS